MHRVFDWNERLADFIAARAAAPFVWGKRANDCISFAAEGVHVMTGVDLLAGAPDWTDEQSARAALRHVGGMRQAIAARLPRIDVGAAGRGDVCLARSLWQGRLHTLCALVGDVHLVAPGPLRLAMLPRSAIVRAYRVG